MQEHERVVNLRRVHSEAARVAYRDGSSGTRGDLARVERRVLVIGAPADLPRALAHPAVTSRRFAIVESIAIDIDDQEMEAGGSGLGRLDVARLLQAGAVDTLLIAGEIGARAMRRVADLALAFHCGVLAVIPTEVMAEHAPVIVWSGESPLVQLSKFPRHPIENVAKRVIDVVGSLLGLVAAAPFLLVLAGLIALESPGHPLFCHERIGWRGRKFRCLKLRTMRADAEDVLRADRRMYEQYRQNHYKIPDDEDPRVTTVGRFLRQTSLDELPQLWNVLIGDMSLVGPRPVVEEELAMYGDDRDLMLSVKPGLTGAWAVNGRQSVGYPDRCQMELRYVRERSLAVDARIIARTAIVVLRPLRQPV